MIEAKTHALTLRRMREAQKAVRKAIMATTRIVFIDNAMLYEMDRHLSLADLLLDNLRSLERYEAEYRKALVPNKPAETEAVS